VAGFDRPAHLDRIADFEKFGASRARIGEQRFELAASWRRDDVHGHVSQVEVFGDGAAEAIVRSIARSRRRSGRLHADLFRAQRDRAGGERRGRCGRHANGAKTGNLERDDAARIGCDRPLEQVAGTDEVGDEARRRKAVQARGLVDLLDPPLVHHGDPVRQRERLGLIVRHIDERDADLLLQIDQLDLHLLAQLGVERGQRLVEQQHCRMRDQRPADRHPLLLAAGKLVRIAFAEAGQAHILEGFADLAGNLRRRRLRHLQRKCDVALDRHVRKQRVTLEYRAHRPFFRRPVGQVGAVEQDAPAVGQIEPCDHAQQCRLAAAGRPEQSEKLAGLDVDADAVDRRELTEPARHVLDFEQRHRGRIRPVQKMADCSKRGAFSRGSPSARGHRCQPIGGSGR
jgi:hypothetical protein